MKKSYQILDHTADLRIRVSGDNPADLFTNAGLALFDMIVSPYASSAEAWTQLSVSGDDRADLLVNFLRELLYLWTGEEKVVTIIHVEEISETDIGARIGFRSFQPDLFEIVNEIKAVTYHQIEVKQTDAGWQAAVVFDI